MSTTKRMESREKLPGTMSNHQLVLLLNLNIEMSNTIMTFFRTYDFLGSLKTKDTYGFGKNLIAFLKIDKCLIIEFCWAG